MRLCIAGSRDVADKPHSRTLIAIAISRWVEAHGWPDEVIHGDCDGVDRLAAEFMRGEGIKVTPYPADWARLGRRAGPARNAVMAQEATHLLAMPKGMGTGTWDMINAFKKAHPDWEEDELVEVEPWAKAEIRFRKAMRGGI